MRLASRGERTFQAINVILMLFICVIFIYPYLNVLAKAFNEGTDSALGGITIFPRKPTLMNFRLLLQDPVTVKAGVISIARVVVGTLIALVVQFSAAYAFTKKRLRGRTGLLFYLMIPMFFNGGLIPYYVLSSKLGLLNSFLMYVIPGAFSIFNMIIIRTYLYTIPDSIEESAKLEGANEIVILWKMIIPLSAPIIATIGLWTAVNYWNDWVTTLYFVTDTKLYTLQFLLEQMIRESERMQSLIHELNRQTNLTSPGQGPKATSEAFQAAQIIITTVPIIIVYPFLQKYFIKGVMIGAVKD